MWRPNPDWIRSFKGGVTRCAREANALSTRCKSASNPKKKQGAARIAKREAGEEEAKRKAFKALDPREWLDSALQLLQSDKDGDDDIHKPADLHPDDVRILLDHDAAPVVCRHHGPRM